MRGAPMTTGALPFTARRPRARAEEAIQAAIIAYVEAVIPRCFAYANANAARRTAGGRAANAVPGLKPGVPDVTVDYPHGGHFYLEVKTPTGVLSEAQERVIAHLRLINHRVAVVTGIDDVKAALRDWGIRTRESAS